MKNEIYVSEMFRNGVICWRACSLEEGVTDWKEYAKGLLEVE